MSQPPDHDLKALWQGQETETPTMTATAIRALARNYGDSIRGFIWMGLVVAAIEVAIFGSYAWRAPNELMRAGWLIILAGVGWMTWRVIRKWPARLPPTDASTGALIAFHRAALERQRSNFTSLTVTVAPVFLGMFVALAGMHKARPHAALANMAPVILLIVAWWFAAFVLNRRQAKRLDAQIAEMDDLAGR